MDWRTLERIDPWGQTREDYRNAHLIAMIANMMANGERKKQYRAEDFLLVFKDASAIAEEQSQAYIESAIKTWVAAANIAQRREAKKKSAVN